MAPPTPHEKQYIGDGVYVRFDGQRVIVTTEDGLKETNVVYFEFETLSSFIRYLQSAQLLP